MEAVRNLVYEPEKKNTKKLKKKKEEEERKTQWRKKGKKWKEFERGNDGKCAGLKLLLRSMIT